MNPRLVYGRCWGPLPSGCPQLGLQRRGSLKGIFTVNLVSVWGTQRGCDQCQVGWVCETTLSLGG